MKRNFFLRTVLTAILINSLIACSVLQPANGSATPLRIAYTQRWGDYTLLVAEEKGLFEKYGVEVEPVYYDVTSDIYTDLASGQVDGALIAIGDVMSIDRHTPVNVIGLQDDGGYMPIIARPEILNINFLTLGQGAVVIGAKELKHVSIGILTGTQYEASIEDMFKSVGIFSQGQTRIINVNPEDVPEALKNGTIQAGFTREPYTTQALSENNHIIFPTDSAARPFPNTIVFQQGILKQDPQKMTSFMQAWFEAVNYRLINPEETRQIASKYTGVPINQIVIDTSLKIFTREDNLLLYSKGAVNSIFATAQKTADFLIILGVLTISPNMDEIINRQFLGQN